MTIDVVDNVDDEIISLIPKFRDAFRSIFIICHVLAFSYRHFTRRF